MALVLEFGETFIHINTEDKKVIFYALQLLPLLPTYQLFDAIQNLAVYILRAYQVTFAPMIIQLLSLWGIGFVGGHLLCFKYSYGVSGFWLSMNAALIFNSFVFMILMLYKTKQICNKLPNN